jgi:uncharacterized membrane protein
MEPLLILFGLAIIGYLLFGPLVALLRARDAKREVKELAVMVTELRAQMRELHGRMTAQERERQRAETGVEVPGTRRAAEPEGGAVSQPQAVQPAIRPVAAPAVSLPPPAITTAPPPMMPPPVLPAQIRAEGISVPPPLPVPVVLPEPSAMGAMAGEVRSEASVVRPGMPPPVARVTETKAAFSLEQFLGVKMFAWVGGLALFMGIVFFVKYAFEHNLISPALRTTMGFLVGGGLVASGVRMRGSKTYQVLAQTLAATGVLILYGVTYAAHELYHFSAFGTVSTFAYMSLITVGAFYLAVRMEAQVIAVLGMAGGFLTPILVSTGHDNPLGLFGYITLLDLGLIAVAKVRRWNYLIICGAAGTVLMQAGWFFRFFESGHYAENALWVPMTIHLFFPALFAAATAWLRGKNAESLHPAIGGLMLAGWSMLVAFMFLGKSAITAQPVVLNGFLFAINVLVLWQIWLQPKMAPAQWAAALMTFLHLAIWSERNLSTETLYVALGSYLIFGLMHTGFALLAMRKRPEVMQSQRYGIWLGPVATLLILIPILGLPSVPWVVWPAILVLNLMTVAVAFLMLRLAPVLLSLCITLVAIGIYLFEMPVHNVNVFGFLTVLGGFSMMFMAAGALLARHVLQKEGGKALTGSQWLMNIQGLLPICAAVLPFVLLIAAFGKLHLADPSPVFGLGLVLSVLLLAMMRMAKLPALGVAALVCMTALEYAWHLTGTVSQPAWKELVWFVGVASLFAAYPFVWKKQFQNIALPWQASAMAWVVHFPLVHMLIQRAYPNDFMGLVPALFSVPALLSLAAVLKMPAPVDAKVRSTQLAWFGGVALLFITLIIPIQFDRQWITVGWALEGAALCWLFTRVPHEGLRKVGVGLLVTAFVRLALNPAVLTYQPHSATPIWNWFLYTYGMVAFAQASAAWWLAPPRHRMEGFDVRALLWSFSAVLLFLLLNIEIADFYTPQGSRFIIFEFGGNFARDMVYSIAWAMFALVLLILGFWKHTKGVRYAGIGLMGITLLKLFFNDLANIGSVYRIGALMVVAVIALGASFLYQRFFSREDEGKAGS